MAKYQNEVNYRITTTFNKSGITQLQSQLSAVQNKIQTMQAQGLYSPATAKNDIKNIQEVSKLLNKSYNASGGILNMKQFTSGMKQAGISMGALQTTLGRTGTVGTQAFNSIVGKVSTFQQSLKQTTALTQQISTTLGNTVRWGLVAGAFQEVMSSIGSAVNYVKELDQSLTQITMVSGESRDNMKEFADYANKAAASLGAATTTYTDAVKVFIQEGFNLEESKAQANQATVLANVSEQDSGTTADQITAYRNAFGLSIKEMDTSLDKIANIANKTASNVNELMTASQKAASTAKSVGASEDTFLASIATIQSVTRESAENIGNGMKSIYTRFADLKMGKDTDDGVSYGQYSSALKAAGVDILDANGKYKGMDQILSELQNVWKTLDESQKLAVGEKVAGRYQYNRFATLMNNQEYYDKAYAATQNADGSMAQMQEDYMEGLAGKGQAISTNIENIFTEIYKTGIVDDLASGMLSLSETFSKLFDAINSGVPVLSGVTPIISGIIALLTKLGGKTMAEGISNMVSNREARKTQSGNMQLATQNARNELIGKGIVTETSRLNANQSRYVGTMAAANLNLRNLNTQELENYTQASNAAVQALNELDAAQNKVKQTNLLMGQALQTLKNNIPKEEFAALSAAFNEASTAGQKYDVLLTACAEGNAELSDVLELARVELIETEDALGSLSGKAFAVDDALNKLKEGEISAAEGAEALTKFSSQLNSRLQELEASGQGASAEAQTIRGILNEMAPSLERVSAAVKVLTDASASAEERDAALETVITEMGYSASDTAQFLERLNNMMKEGVPSAQRLENIIQGCGNAVSAASQKFEQGVASLEHFSNASIALRGRVQLFSDSLMAISTGIMSISMTVGSLKNAFDTLNDSSATQEEKLSAVTNATMMLTMGIGMTIMSINQWKTAMQGVRDAYAMTRAVEEADLVLKELQTDATMKQALAELGLGKAKLTEADMTKINSAAAKGNAAAKKIAAAASGTFEGATKKSTIAILQEKAALMLANPAFWAIAAAVSAVVIAATGLKVAYDTVTSSTHNATDSFESAKTAVEGLQEAASKSSEEFDKLSSSIEKIKDNKNSLAEMTRGTKEWRDTVRELNGEVLNLITEYPKLAKYVENNNGVLSLNKNGTDQLLNEQESKMREYQNAAVVQSQLAENLKSDKLIEDFYNSEEGSALVAETAGAIIGAGGAGIATGAALGATAGSIVPIAGTILGAAAGALIGGTAGLAVNSGVEQAKGRTEGHFSEEINKLSSEMTKVSEGLESAGVFDSHLEAAAEQLGTTKDSLLSLVESVNANSEAVKGNTVALTGDKGTYDVDPEKAAQKGHELNKQMWSDLQDGLHGGQWDDDAVLNNATIRKYVADKMGINPEDITGVDEGSKGSLTFKYRGKDGDSEATFDGKALIQEVDVMTGTEALLDGMDGAASKIIAGLGGDPEDKDTTLENLNSSQYQKVLGEDGKVDQGKLQDFVSEIFANGIREEDLNATTKALATFCQAAEASAAATKAMGDATEDYASEIEKEGDFGEDEKSAAESVTGLTKDQFNYMVAYKLEKDKNYQRMQNKYSEYNVDENGKLVLNEKESVNDVKKLEEEVASSSSRLETLNQGIEKYISSNKEADEKQQEYQKTMDDLKAKYGGQTPYFTADRGLLQQNIDNIEYQKAQKGFADAEKLREGSGLEKVATSYDEQGAPRDFKDAAEAGTGKQYVIRDSSGKAMRDDKGFIKTYASEKEAREANSVYDENGIKVQASDRFASESSAAEDEASKLEKLQDKLDDTRSKEEAFKRATEQMARAQARANQTAQQMNETFDKTKSLLQENEQGTGQYYQGIQELGEALAGLTDTADSSALTNALKTMDKKDVLKYADLAEKAANGDQKAYDEANAWAKQLEVKQMSEQAGEIDVPVGIEMNTLEEAFNSAEDFFESQDDLEIGGTIKLDDSPFQTTLDTALQSGQLTVAGLQQMFSDSTMEPQIGYKEMPQDAGQMGEEFNVSMPVIQSELKGGGKVTGSAKDGLSMTTATVGWTSAGTQPFHGEMNSTPKTKDGKVPYIKGWVKKGSGGGGSAPTPKSSGSGGGGGGGGGSAKNTSRAANKASAPRMRGTPTKKIQNTKTSNALSKAVDNLNKQQNSLYGKKAFADLKKYVEQEEKRIDNIKKLISNQKTLVKALRNGQSTNDFRKWLSRETGNISLSYWGKNHTGNFDTAHGDTSILNQRTGKKIKAFGMEDDINKKTKIDEDATFNKWGYKLTNRIKFKGLELDEDSYANVHDELADLVEDARIAANQDFGTNEAAQKAAQARYDLLKGELESLESAREEYLSSLEEYNGFLEEQSSIYDELQDAMAQALGKIKQYNEDMKTLWETLNEIAKLKIQDNGAELWGNSLQKATYALSDSWSDLDEILTQRNYLISDSKGNALQATATGNQIDQAKALISYFDSQLKTYNDYVSAYDDELSTVGIGSERKYGDQKGKQIESETDLNEYIVTLKKLRQSKSEEKGYLGLSHDELIQQYKDGIASLQEVVSTYESTLKNIYDGITGAISSINDMLQKIEETYDRIDERLQNGLSLLQTAYGEQRYRLENQILEEEIAVEAAKLTTLNNKLLANSNTMTSSFANYEELLDQQNEMSDQFYNDVIITLTNIYSLLQSSLSNEVNQQIQDFLAAVGFNDLEWQQSQWDLENQISEGYYDDTERAYNIQKLSNEYKQLLNDTDLLDIQRMITNQMNEQIDLLENKNELSEYDVEYAEKQLEILKAQIALREAEDNKSTLKLRRDASGNYGYVYTADNNDIISKQQALLDAQNEAYELSKEHLKETQETISNATAEYTQALVDIATNTNLTQEEQIKRLQYLQEQYQKYMKNISNISQTAFTNIGDDINKLGGMFESSVMNETFSQLLNGVLNSNYGTQLGEQFNMKFFEILSKPETWNIMSSQLTQGIKTSIDSYWGALEKYAQMLGFDPSNGSSLEQFINKIVKDSSEQLTKVEEKNSTTLNDISENVTNISNNLKNLKNEINNFNKLFEGENSLSGIIKKAISDVATEQGISVDTSETSNDKKQLARNTDPEAKAFASGGYTGTWSDTTTEEKNGKLAFLHQKELVLNASDTSKILEAVKLVRDMKINAMSETQADLISKLQPRDTKETIEQRVQIDATFPNAESASEIKQALLSLADNAYQLASRNY